jgi:hypothetical protein
VGGDDYVGLDVHRAARIAAAGHGGQVLVSSATSELVRASLPDGVGLRDLGEYRLKDLARPECIYQLTIDAVSAEFPPIRSRETPTNLPTQRTSFVGRDRAAARGRLRGDQGVGGGHAPPPLVDLPDPREAARSALGEGVMRAAWEEGRAMTLDQAWGTLGRIPSGSARAPSREGRTRTTSMFRFSLRYVTLLTSKEDA